MGNARNLFFGSKVGIDAKTFWGLTTDFADGTDGFLLVSDFLGNAKDSAFHKTAVEGEQDASNCC
jgi:hypothetical protein